VFEDQRLGVLALTAPPTLKINNNPNTNRIYIDLIIFILLR
jgi:hypothetical protein